jgi:hypothetical protein
MFKGKALNLTNKPQFDHHPNIPDPFREIIVGASGSGKTTLYLQKALEPKFINYNNLVMFTPNPKDKDEYQFLNHGYINRLSKEDLGEIWLAQDDLRKYNLPISKICEMFSSLREKAGDLHGDVTATLSDKIKEIPLPENLNKIYGRKNHYMVFDDCARENKKMMEIYYTESRHAHCNCTYIAQDFFDLPQNVRINSNFITLFEQDPMKLSKIYPSCIGDRIMDKDEFMFFANTVWSRPNGYVTINKVTKKVTDDIFYVEEED